MWCPQLNLLSIRCRRESNKKELHQKRRHNQGRGFQFLLLQARVVINHQNLAQQVASLCTSQDFSLKCSKRFLRFHGRQSQIYQEWVLAMFKWWRSMVEKWDRKVPPQFPQSRKYEHKKHPGGLVVHKDGDTIRQHGQQKWIQALATTTASHKGNEAGTGCTLPSILLPQQNQGHTTTFLPPQAVDWVDKRSIKKQEVKGIDDMVFVRIKMAVALNETL